VQARSFEEGIFLRKSRVKFNSLESDSAMEYLYHLACSHVIEKASISHENAGSFLRAF
jgi:hypothetical protein